MESVEFKPDPADVQSDINWNTARSGSNLELRLNKRCNLYEKSGKTSGRLTLQVVYNYRGKKCPAKYVQSQPVYALYLYLSSEGDGIKRTMSSPLAWLPID